MHDPIISVIIPTWNRRHIVGKAIESVMSQTYPVHEVLVCDDGSTDDTESYICSLSYSNVKWISGERGGRPAIPRNRGLAEASGQWVAFLDSDDYWEPHKLATQIENAKKHNCKAVCSNSWSVIPQGSEKSLMYSCKDNEITWKQMLRSNHVACSTMLLDKALLQYAGGFPESERLTVGEDYALWLRIAAMTNIYYTAEPLMYYLDDPAHSVRAKSLDAWTQRIIILENFVRWCDCHTNIIKEQTLNFARREIRKARIRLFLSQAKSCIKRK